MAEVTPRYTEISVEECVRIANQLTKNLEGESIYCDYRLQGSVPTNTHIRGISDVDFLVIIKNQCYYDKDGPKANQYFPYDGNLFGDLVNLRSRSETVLSKQFPAADVDVSGKKSIKISGGSLRREVDVVPSVWFNSKEYQINNLESYRGIDILDRSVPTTIRNYPFLHILKINDKGAQTFEGVKMGIRLLKNIRSDSDQSIELSSYELAGLLWHCPDDWIKFYQGFDLSVLAGVDQYLNALASNHELATSLITPDGTRKILDRHEKYMAMVRLSQEVSALANEVFSELPNSVRAGADYDVARKRQILSENYVA
ncbi:hypothetical protein IQ229_22230 [Nostoc cf. edaphicum LEGE 07299]|uniref:cGAS/DncV-like nucleotidyltransferase C-terminal helical domain-containing protein n=1 Tax=Nostoc cf. edaphicum LEGE 07299 TaxID=2777974 RepID=A0ABR9U4E4_9NOSO|nr:hypothetical protein [Nostoc edaphicum]MBE9107545.1 hypothetical protein [Nostoc cf. edaphicum LEGE 07299]